jgi:PAS domain S-box-containing protein
MSGTTFNVSPGAGRRILSPFVVLILFAAAIPFAVWPRLLTSITSTNFLPHRFCYLSDAKLIWLHVISDILIGVAYVSISATLAFLVHRARRDIPFSWMFLAFGLFIVACGGTHFMEVVTVWRPFYWLAGDVKVVTALASVTTAMSLPTLVPKVLDLLAVSRVATQHKADLESAHRRLQELEEMLRAASRRAAAGTATWEWDLSSGAIAWAGDVATVWGRQAPELSTADDVYAAIDSSDLQRVRNSIDLALRAKGEFEEEFRIRSKEGGVCWIIGRGRVHLDENGRPVAMVGVNIDVTARKRAEEALRTSEKLAVAGRMAAAIAHEINNPLHAIGNLIYLIRNDASLSATGFRYAEMADTELKRVAHIVRQTLAFYRESSTPVPVSVNEIVDNVIQLHQKQIVAKDIRVERRFETETMVMALPGEVRQVLANLITNAIDALPRRGRLILHIYPSRDWTTGQRGVRVSVADTGNGIPQDFKQRIFEPFFTTKGERGTGLGLWVAAGIVDKHAGRIRLRTSTHPASRGTVFSVFLPSSSNKFPKTMVSK